MSDRGFVVLEWLVASALVIVLASAVFSAVAPMRDLIERTQHRVDMAVAARGALDLVVNDTLEAGSNTAIGDADVFLADVLPPFLLLEDLESGTPAQAATAIVINRTPLNGAQGRLLSDVAAGESLLRLATSARCSSGSPACGFDAGDRAVLFTPSVAEVVVIAETLAGEVTLTQPVSNAFPVGSVLCRLITTTYGLRDEDGDARLVRLTDGGAEQPLLDNVVAFEIQADDPNPLMARRLHVRLRVQAAAEHLRGPEGYLFGRAGTAPGPRRWLPDVQLRAELTLRNARGPV